MAETLSVWLRPRSDAKASNDAPSPEFASSKVDAVLNVHVCVCVFANLAEQTHLLRISTMQNL